MGNEAETFMQVMKLRVFVLYKGKKSYLYGDFRHEISARFF